ncbi:hypothetical protein AB0883_14915 [Micromonospora sp. NPDC047812]|uniref:hypothetical protein n=1 Tax=Micromonospora sp. NPDC047812 TaxID=3155742 RepID=UPI003454CED4
MLSAPAPADGLDLVVDLTASRGSTPVDARTGGSNRLGRGRAPARLSNEVWEVAA